MDLISLKCPNCAGKIELESTREVGYCTYCGEKVILSAFTEQTVKVDNSGLIKNWLSLAQHAYESRNVTDINKYTEKILETDISNVDAWFMKGSAAAFELDLDGAVQCWKRTFMYIDNAEKFDYFSIHVARTIAPLFLVKQPEISNIKAASIYMGILERMSPSLEIEVTCFFDYIFMDFNEMCELAEDSIDYANKFLFKYTFWAFYIGTNCHWSTIFAQSFAMRMVIEEKIEGERKNRKESRALLNLLELYLKMTDNLFTTFQEYDESIEDSDVNLIEEHWKYKWSSNLDRSILLFESLWKDRSDIMQKKKRFFGGKINKEIESKRVEYMVKLMSPLND